MPATGRLTTPNISDLGVPQFAGLGRCVVTSHRRLPSPREPDARARRPMPWLHERTRPVLADGLQPTAAGDTLPRDAVLDGSMVLAEG